MGLGCMFGHLMHGRHSHSDHDQRRYQEQEHQQNHNHNHNHNEHQNHGKQSSDPLEVLKLRFVKGEITEEEYRRMKEVLSE
ncbi:SHOCT domain-containing protein [Tepidibacillus infernus]|uniref:SHOCT domain-containing protein n=1 Tax=Tepidibacillus decaturensis TaxID=1413211 RepID=A0A135L1Q1_9BACI|nr:SHOCT domain-containing protein [Tepidibacillus decaturensis]KXG42928.1 hypothetical protein U473_01965 [Tepidibacillus decaturensis]